MTDGKAHHDETEAEPSETLKGLRLFDDAIKEPPFFLGLSPMRMRTAHPLRRGCFASTMRWGPAIDAKPLPTPCWCSCRRHLIQGIPIGEFETVRKGLITGFSRRREFRPYTIVPALCIGPKLSTFLRLN